jgi:hypothetical protein
MTGPAAINGVTINCTNCMESISGLGIVVAGTDNGVVTLE